VGEPGEQPKHGLVGFFTSAAGLVTAVVGLVSALLGLLAFSQNANPESHDPTLATWARKADHVCERAHPPATQALTTYLQGIQTGNLMLTAQGGQQLAQSTQEAVNGLTALPSPESRSADVSRFIAKWETAARSAQDVMYSSQQSDPAAVNLAASRYNSALVAGSEIARTLGADKCGEWTAS